MIKPTDYRAKLEDALTPRSAGWVGPRRARELLDGFASQAVREHRERWTAEAAKEERTHSEVLVDALHMHGFTPDAARRYIREFHDAITSTAVKNSDHESYRVLADAVEKTMGEVADPNDWDGDDSEEYILCQFLAWLPDMLRHADAEKIRIAAVEREGTWTPHGLDGIRFAADAIDPFERDGEGQWTRKSDGAPVPWSVVKE